MRLVIPVSSLAPSCHVRTQRTGSHLWTRNGVFTGRWICRCCDLGLLVCRTVSNKFLLFISHPVCDTLLQQREWAKTSPSKPHNIYSLLAYLYFSSFSLHDAVLLLPLSFSSLRSGHAPFSCLSFNYGVKLNSFLEVKYLGSSSFFSFCILWEETFVILMDSTIICIF